MITSRGYRVSVRDFSLARSLCVQCHLEGHVRPPAYVTPPYPLFVFWYGIFSVPSNSYLKSPTEGTSSSRWVSPSDIQSVWIRVSIPFTYFIITSTSVLAWSATWTGPCRVEHQHVWHGIVSTPLLNHDQLFPEPKTR